NAVCEEETLEEEHRSSEELRLWNYRLLKVFFVLLSPEGFSLGSMVQSHTKGIRMWCVRHPKKPNYTLVLLDTKGLGDVEKGDNQNDSWIFALAILLSSTFVYNSMGTINQQAMDQLQYPFCGPEQHQNQSHFYLSPGTSLKNEKFNLPRLCIRKFFPKKKCFVFDRPTHRKKLGQLETMQDDELDPEFVQQAADFCSYIFSNSKVTTLSGGIQVNGPRLETLVMTYVSAISSRDLPCMENAILALAQIENSAAVQKAIAHYDQQMSEKVQLPTETLQELLDLHMASEKEAIEVFMKNSFKDVDHLFKNKARNNFCKENIKASSDRCSALLKDNFQSLEEDIKQGVYSKSGGYRLLMQTVNELKKKYLQEPRKGIQSEEVLHTYLRSKESVIDAILQKDQNLTKREKLIEVQRMKAESAEAAAKMLEEMQKKNQQMMEEEEKIYQEYVKQLAEKMEQERAQLMAEQERALSLKLQEQAMLQKEGFQDESRQLQREIENLKNNMARSRKKCILI
ncbi:PREDICTED: guanylate-binding protein 1-like, partial [Myotis davidii]|uniref:guanylate-binding protein 1-like n=1 Tax=Myotis davidii TaxID=225400 RepID=UPI0007674A4A